MSEKTKNILEYISEQFGANATYVEGLLDRYKANPNTVDESWREYFGELLGGTAASAGNGGAAAPTPAQPAAKPPAKETKLTADTEAKPITGAAKKIVENMEESLTVPTATSFREIPVKLLEEKYADSLWTAKAKAADF